MKIVFFKKDMVHSHEAIIKGTEHRWRKRNLKDTTYISLSVPSGKASNDFNTMAFSMLNKLNVKEHYCIVTWVRVTYWTL